MGSRSIVDKETTDFVRRRHTGGPLIAILVSRNSATNKHTAVLAVLDVNCWSLDEVNLPVPVLDVAFRPQMIKSVFTTSVGRDPAPNIEPQIQAACETLYQRLCKHLELR